MGRRAWIGVSLWLAAVAAAAVAAAWAWPWATHFGVWQRVGTFGNAGLAALCLAAASFFWQRMLARRSALNLLAAVGLTALAVAHALLPGSALGLVAENLMLPVGRMLRAVAAALLLPCAVREFWRVRPWRGGGQ